MRWIDLNDRMGLPLKRHQILSTATAILRETEPAAPVLNHRWLKQWLERHPEYKIRRRKSLDRERLKAQDRDHTLKWFEGYENAISSYGIQREDLYNFDESGFQMGIGKDQWIVTREPRRKIVSGTDTNREYVTVVEAVSADGYAIPPLIILTAKRLSHQWFDFIEDEHIAVTDSGYINDALAYQWIQHFDRSTRARCKGAWRMLLMDGFGSHLTYEFAKFCEKKKILPFCLPPHSSHILQPLDVGVFNVYKHWHSQAIEEATATGCTKFTKTEFLAAINSIRQKTFKNSTISNGFRLTGIWPVNAAVVCDQLVSYDPRKERTPLCSTEDNSTCSNLSTPKSIQRIKRLENKLIALSSDLRSSKKIVEKLSKAAQTCLYEVKELERDKEATKAATLARHARADTSRTYFSTRGIVSAADCAKMKRIEFKTSEQEALNKRRRKFQREVLPQLKRFSRRKLLRVQLKRVIYYG
ncbi:hypothetical protein N7494_005158 [Penicillium frequentans]|uniref:HTH CENPB-type domain-containing protein n=1 Tax=Penicillium frequentans TaxID=3151616 RepID=A0AAD6CXF9_9EURO|nr:hypothetical protein N7494_005158 [Penicillium glabrum]